MFDVDSENLLYLSAKIPIISIENGIFNAGNLLALPIVL
jgi:hypothetical protein